MQLINELWITSHHFWSINDNVVFISSLITLPYPYTVLPEGQADCNCALILSLLPMFHYWHMSHGSWKPFTLPNTCLHHKVSGIFLLFYVLKYFTEFYNISLSPFSPPAPPSYRCSNISPAPLKLIASFSWVITDTYTYVYISMYMPKYICNGNLLNLVCCCCCCCVCWCVVSEVTTLH